jgi:hypothetical protein
MQLRLLVLASLLICANHSPAEAGVVDRLRLPESIPGLQMPKSSYDLLQPTPVNSSWARSGHRPVGVTLANYNLTTLQIDAVRQTGCGLVRLIIPFEPFFAAMDSEGQPVPDLNDNWMALDLVVSRLKRAELEILPTLTATVNPDLSQFQRFCTAVAQRYGPTFDYYQILDNINYFRGLPSQEYADLVASARISIVTADPGAQIVSGSVRGCDLAYLELLEVNGALPFIDILAFNLFPPSDGIEGVSRKSMWMHSLPLMERALAWARNRGKAVWVSSLGVPTSYGDPHDLGVDQFAQASMYARSAILLGNMGVERIIFAAIQDTDPYYIYPAQCCGVLDVGGAPKASYFALTNLAQLVHEAYQAAPGFVVAQRVVQRLSEADLFNAAGQGTFEGGDPLGEFPVRGIAVYAFWLYNPVLKEYRMVYWLGTDPSTEYLITFTVFDSELRALDVRQLLDSTSSEPPQSLAGNLTMVPYQPISSMPTVLRFKVGRDARR